MQRLKEISKKIAERKAKIRISLKSLVDQLKNFGALKIYVFGSYNRDEIDVNSDLDLFVIMPSNKTGKEWINFIYSNIEREVSSDIIVFNIDEFNDQLPTSSFLTNIIQSGSLIYEKT